MLLRATLRLEVSLRVDGQRRARDGTRDTHRGVGKVDGDGRPASFMVGSAPTAATAEVVVLFPADGARSAHASIDDHKLGA